MSRGSLTCLLNEAQDTHYISEHDWAFDQLCKTSHNLPDTMLVATAYGKIFILKNLIQQYSFFREMSAFPHPSSPGLALHSDTKHCSVA